MNIQLQGRYDRYPKRRGKSREKVMLAANILLCLGHDDLIGPCYPPGTPSLLLVLHVCQLRR
ncbi:cytosine deaminase [Erwinia amylovora]|uniref:cytosine deaminase n=1 Tax=Erwinia amylovora TaxID=552 RepID=UPI0020BF5F8D|nr:cytosine deaminase [Erwinia amylovora]MCK8306079.1 cytosine deaminase [Erwinia amylovora]